MSQLFSISDKDLLRKIASGNHRAFNMLYKRYNRQFLSWVQLRVLDAGITKDVVQEFWIKLWENAGNYKTDQSGSAKGYLLKSLSYYTTDFLRKSLSLSDELDEKQWEVLNDTSGYTHVAELLEEKELRRIINETLSSLPELTRLVYSLRSKGNTIKETAQMADLSEKTVKIHFRAAKDALKESVLKAYGSVSATGKHSFNDKLLLLLIALEIDRLV